MTPLTKKEKLYTLALSLPFLLRTNDKDAFLAAVKHMAHLIDRDDFAELKELIRRGKEAPKGIKTDEFYEKASELTDDILGCIPDDLDLKTPLHMMSVKERIYHIAIGIGKAMKNLDIKIIADGAAMLGYDVTDELIKEAQDEMMNAFKTCGCAACLAEIKIIGELKKMEAEQQNKPDDIDDPFKGFAA